MRTCCSFAVVALLALAGCNDRGITGSHLAGARAADAGEYPDLSEFESTAPSVWVAAVAYAWFSPGGTAFGGAQTHGYANHVSQNLQMRVYSQGQELSATPVSTEEFSQFTPRLFVLQDTVTIPGTVSCDRQATANVSSRAAIRVISQTQIFDLWPVTTSSSRTGWTQPCDPPASECDDPFTDEIEACGEGGGGGGATVRVGGGRQTEQPAFEHGGGFSDKWVCEVTDWYISWDGGQTWTYEETTVDACWIE